MERTRAISRGNRSGWWMTNGVDLGDFRLIDRALVNINEDREVRYWTAIFRCSTTQLSPRLLRSARSRNESERISRERSLD